MRRHPTTHPLHLGAGGALKAALLNAMAAKGGALPTVEDAPPPPMTGTTGLPPLRGASPLPGLKGFR